MVKEVNDEPNSQIERSLVDFAENKNNSTDAQAERERDREELFISL